MPFMSDRVKETTTTTGTGTVTLAGAVTGYQSFSTAFGSSATVYYTIAGGSEWEVGIGTTGTGTLARTTVLASSNSGSAVNFSAGTKDVFCTAPASRIATVPEDVTTTATTASPKTIGTSDAWKRQVVTTSSGTAQIVLDGTSGIATGTTIGVLAKSAPVVMQVGSTALDLEFKPVVGTNPTEVVVQSDGKVIVAGSFTSAGGSTRNRIARFSTTGTLESYDPNANGTVNELCLQSDGKLLVGGAFTTVSATTRNRVARINTDGTLDTGFDANAGGVVQAIAVESGGKVILGGDFTTVGGTLRNYIARVNSDGTLDTGFNPGANGTVSDIAIQSDGKIIIVGAFTTVASTTRNRIARLNSDGTLDTGFNPNANGNVSVVVLQSNGKILIGGDFSALGSASALRMARLNTDGTIDTAFVGDASNSVTAIAIQEDGSIVFAGSFTSVQSVYLRNRLARVSSDGVVDRAFDPFAVVTAVNSIAVGSDGTMYLAGTSLTAIENSTGFSNLVRYKAYDTNVEWASSTRSPLPRSASVVLEKVDTERWAATSSNV